jgi:hypothetical protein
MGFQLKKREKNRNLIRGFYLEKSPIPNDKQALIDGFDGRSAHLQVKQVS